MQATLIYPHQLFSNHPALSRSRPVYLFEEQLFFRDWHYPARFHRQKLILHRAAMTCYQRELERRGYTVRYIEYAAESEMPNLRAVLRTDNIHTLALADQADDLASRRLRRLASELKIRLAIHESPGFLCAEEEFRKFFADADSLRQTPFYIRQRQRLGVLMDKDRPAGGRWSYDPANREPLTTGVDIPEPPRIRETPQISAARDYVAERFGDHPGEPDSFNWPVTHGVAKRWLEDFCERRLSRFGTYQDAVSRRHFCLFHALIASSLNIGLLTPAQVLEAVDEAGRCQRLPFNQREGFVRQLIGWREYVRALYVLKGGEQRSANFFGHERRLPQAFYNAGTGIPPLDDVIAKLLKTGYAHHIERLMILGNFMLLCEISPTDVYTWFMEMFIDSYDWVMVPNVYGMSQFADGGLMMTKPYVSSSNYLLKMSDYPKGDWCRIWDGLFWRFLDRHREFFQNNPRTRLMAGHLHRMEDSTLKRHIRTAEDFLRGLA